MNDRAASGGCSPEFLRAAAELEEQHNCLDAGQVLLVCAALDSRTGDHTAALARIEQVEAMSERCGSTRLRWWALWAATSLHLRRSDYATAATVLQRLGSDLHRQQEWMLANVVWVVAETLLETVASAHDAPGDLGAEPSLRRILAHLTEWGEPPDLMGGQAYELAQPEQSAARPTAPSVPKGGASPTLVVYCLGNFRADYDDRPIEQWPSRKPVSIFRYLVLSYPAPVPQEVLMDNFWPDADPDAARGSLHQAIYSLRKALKQVAGDVKIIDFEHDSYSLNPELDFWLDVREFDKHIRAGRRLESAGQVEEAIAEYGVAEGLYQGDLLEDDLYEEWLQWPREQKRQSYLDTADRLAEHYLQRGDWPAAIALCHNVLERDHCHERAHTRLMRCYAAQGQRHLAVHQYRACVEALHSELDLAPAPETVELFRQIVSQPQARSN
ncbi:MAG TPA: BTAD domain-containing putative transcriptional regulator [Anaerolineae bacterium]|nr:BTAD domain-containing putative transcriptional regulator [Anaerolineae bacterium]